MIDEVASWRTWDRFVEATPDAGFMQSSSWTRFRARSGCEHFAITLKDGDAVVGGAVVGKWTFEPGRCFYYVQEGPVLPADEEEAAHVFGAVLEGIERHRQAEGATVSHLRIEPRWQALPDFVRGFRPPSASDRFCEPRDTLCIDLRPSKEEILAQMKPKGRYNIGVARRHGVTVVRDDSYQGMVDFTRIQRCTMVRHGLEPQPTKYFQALLTELGPKRGVSLFFAEYRGRRIATALVVFCGRRATYFYGGSLAKHRRVMAPSLLHFEIMGHAKAGGCEWYDLWGIAPSDKPDHAWQQISEFKRKFGGVEVRLVPTLDHVYDAAAYDRFLSVERQSAGKPLTAVATPSRSRVAAAMPSGATPALSKVRLCDPGVPTGQFVALRRAFPESHFRRLQAEGFEFYRTTFWYPLDREPENIFESIAHSLKGQAQPSPDVTGVEWWFSVLQTETTPQWLLPCHFDRSDLAETDPLEVRHPDTASVLFLNAVPHGELVITDQVMTGQGMQPQQPREMRFVSPRGNRYVAFPGHLYHGVIGRMWRPAGKPRLRIAMAVNWWTEKPKAAYLRDSRECMAALRLRQ